MKSGLLLYSNNLLVSDGLAGPAELVPAALAIEGHKIEAVHRVLDRSDAQKLAQKGSFEFLDFGSKAVAPAFVNAHTHLGLGFLRASNPGPAGAGNMVEQLFFEIEEKLTAADVRAFVRMGAYESLLNGVGLVWDHYYFAESVVEALLDTGLSGVVAGTLQDLAGPGRKRSEQQLEATHTIASSETLASRGIFSALGPHATDTVSAALWQQAAEVARKLSLPVHAHAAQSLDEVERAWSRHGTSPVHWLKSLGVLEESPQTLLTHCLFTSREELQELDPKSVTLAFCPYSQKVFGFAADPSRFSDAGLQWIVATDTSAGNDSMNLQKELRAVAELRTIGISRSQSWQEFFESNGVEAAQRAWRERQDQFARQQPLAHPESLLSRVWRTPGELHPHFRAGSLEPGTLANIAVWDLEDPSFWPCPDANNFLSRLAMADTTSALHALIVAGRVIGEPGDLRRSLVESKAYQEARGEADRRRQALLN